MLRRNMTTLNIIRFHEVLFHSCINKNYTSYKNIHLLQALIPSKLSLYVQKHYLKQHTSFNLV